MIGAIVGDVIGSRFERRNYKKKDFTLFHETCKPTDDSIMSLAIALAIMDMTDHGDLEHNAVSCMQKLGRRYPRAGYGGRFSHWLTSDNPEPYGSYGNGSAMRVSPCAYAAESLEKAKGMAIDVSKVTHNHPEGLKGAEAVASAIYLARTGESKEAIQTYIDQNYYPMNFTLDDIREAYDFQVSCQKSVPQALMAFFESTSFEDAIRNAISIGGDSDTIAAITGSIAEAYYGVPENIVLQTLDRLDDTQIEILYHFEKAHRSRAIIDQDTESTVFQIIDDYLL